MLIELPPLCGFSGVWAEHFDIVLGQPISQRSMPAVETEPTPGQHFVVPGETSVNKKRSILRLR